MSTETDAVRVREFDQDIREKNGVCLIAGFDEAGRGPLCGPVACGACVLPVDFKCSLIDDSKKLTPKKRAIAESEIKKAAIAWAVEFVFPEEIDRINIYEASKVGMERCLKRILEQVKVEYIITDFMKLDTDIPMLAILKGDATSQCVAAASILAKTARDEYMDEVAKQYPEYGFAKHKGYPTKLHMEMIRKFGLIPGFYRLSYRPVQEVLKERGYRKED